MTPFQIEQEYAIESDKLTSNLIQKLLNYAGEKSDLDLLNLIKLYLADKDILINKLGETVNAHIRPEKN
jgi:hypothetical protein